MVQLDIVRFCNSALVQSQPLVAVFVGATSGIGRATLYALATVHGNQEKESGKGKGKGLRVYVVGRKKAAAEEIISDCARLCPGGRFIFVPAQDLSLLENVDQVCAEIARLEHDEAAAAAAGEPARVDLLCMSQGDFTFEPRRDTKEGLEFRLSLLYYARMKFTINLLPLLRASSLPAHVISVFGAGKEGQLYLDDLSLREPGRFGSMTMRSHVVYLTTFFMEYLAAQNPDKLSLVHVFPGLIMTEAFSNPGVPRVFRALWTLLSPVIGLLTTSLEECGERVLSLASPLRYPARNANAAATFQEEATLQQPDGPRQPTVPRVSVATGSDGVLGGGAYAVDPSGETVRSAKAYEKYRAEGVGEKLVAHTLKAFEDIKAGKVFTD